MIRVAVTVPGAAAEIVRAVFVELVPSGFEESEHQGRLELAAYVEDPGELLAIFPDAVAVEIDDGWEDAWKAFHRPAVVRGLWIGPPWERPHDGRPAIVIDPGRAFGTGSHATTRLCVELLATGRRASLLDVGCGSGILAIAAARLGFDPISAVDADPVALEAARANAAANGVAVDISLADALIDPLPRADVAVANVLLRPVESILARVEAVEAVTSGYLAGERPLHPGWDHVESLALDGWAADRFRRESV